MLLTITLQFKNTVQVANILNSPTEYKTLSYSTSSPADIIVATNNKADATDIGILAASMHEGNFSISIILITY